MILTIDVNLCVSLGFALVVIGYWMMVSRVKEWAVPVNTLLGIVSVVLAMVWGLLLRGFALTSVVTYGLPNGLLTWVGATAAYDFIHEFVKRRESWLSVWKSFLGLFKKKEAKA